LGGCGCDTKIPKAFGHVIDRPFVHEQERTLERKRERGFGWRIIYALR